MQATKRFIRRPELVAKVGLCATTIFNLERAGKFPKHILLTPRVAVWDETEVDAWMREQMTKAAQPARVPSSHRRTSATVAASMTLSHQLAQALQTAKRPPRQGT
ncbi:MAG: helix-turn-helix transcriptional regulator [Chromatiales bacterium]